MTYKILSKTCGGRTFRYSKLMCPHGGEGCPTVIEGGAEMLIVGRLLQESEIQHAGLNVPDGQAAVAVSRELLICAAEEISEAARKIA